jgi:hypothetical protein
MPAVSLEMNSWSPIRAILHWCQEYTTDRAIDMETCGKSEVEHIAKDIGVAPAELICLARSGPDAADLLVRRMAALDLDRAEVRRVAPRALQDMQRVCTLCSKHRRCAHDFARNQVDPAWKRYCPNVETLMALDAMPWAARSEW